MFSSLVSSSSYGIAWLVDLSPDMYSLNPGMHSLLFCEHGLITATSGGATIAVNKLTKELDVFLISPDPDIRVFPLGATSG